MRAVETLCHLAEDNDNNKVSIATAGAIPPLVALVQNGSDRLKGHAAIALLNLALKNDKNMVSIVEADAIIPLVELLKNGTVAAKTQAAAALSCRRLGLAANVLVSLASNNDNNKVLIVKAGAIPLLVALLKNGHYAGGPFRDALRLLRELSYYS